MLRQHRLARFLLPLSRKPVARAGDPARPRAGPEPLAVHRYLYPAKNGDKEAASQHGSGLDYAELPMKEDAAFPRSRAMIHLANQVRSEEHTSELQSRFDLVCRLLLEKKNSLDSALLRFDFEVR